MKVDRDEMVLVVGDGLVLQNFVLWAPQKVVCRKKTKGTISIFPSNPWGHRQIMRLGEASIIYLTLDICFVASFISL